MYTLKLGLSSDTKWLGFRKKAIVKGIYTITNSIRLNNSCLKKDIFIFLPNLALGSKNTFILSFTFLILKWVFIILWLYISAHSASLNILAKYTLYLSDLVKSIFNITIMYIIIAANYKDRKMYRYSIWFSIPRKTNKFMNKHRIIRFMR